ncbi:hypothetical protein PF008_g17239 [Phytophthora fragariae]|uniref:Uncharacterized protein n=1 Tax=Phytophthora fragariae TaxID=53985 RepID=A0A6G0RA11_9STRA|nr:hypothetical protein PF008_g17239 [Phytophthora fragariae]
MVCTLLSFLPDTHAKARHVWRRHLHDVLRWSPWPPQAQLARAICCPSSSPSASWPAVARSSRWIGRPRTAATSAASRRRTTSHTAPSTSRHVGARHGPALEEGEGVLERPRPHRRRATWVHGTDLRWKREKEFWNGHGYIVDPTAQRASGYLTNGYGSRVDNEAWEIYDNSKYDYGVNGTLNFVQATFLTKRYDSLGAFITKNQELVDSKTDPNCRLTVYKDSTRSKLPASKLSPTGFTHMRSGATTLATLVARRPTSRAKTTPARTIVSGTMRSCATRCARWRNTLPGCATSTW